MKIAVVCANGKVGKLIVKEAEDLYDMADGIRKGTSAQCFEGTTEELCKTVNTQPCVFTADLSFYSKML